MALLAIEKPVPAGHRCITRFNAVVDTSIRDVRSWMMRVAEQRRRGKDELVAINDGAMSGDLLGYFHGAKTAVKQTHPVDFGMSFITREVNRYDNSELDPDNNLDARIPAYRANNASS